MSNEIPRRNRMDQWTPAELAIYDAVQAVEAMAADVRLTDAVVLLQAARDSVADYIDNLWPNRRYVHTEPASASALSPEPAPCTCLDVIRAEIQQQTAYAESTEPHAGRTTAGEHRHTAGVLKCMLILLEHRAALSPEPPKDDIGLSVDMLDVDRLREWARLLLVHGADISHWGSVPFVAGKMQTMATCLEKAIRDIGVLRAALSPSSSPSRVEKFIQWVERTPHNSLVGDSRVAYEAQVRVLHQLRWYLEGGDEALNAYVDLASSSPSANREPQPQEWFEVRDSLGMTVALFVYEGQAMLFALEFENATVRNLHESRSPDGDGRNDVYPAFHDVQATEGAGETTHRRTCGPAIRSGVENDARTVGETRSGESDNLQTDRDAIAGAGSEPADSHHTSALRDPPEGNKKLPIDHLRDVLTKHGSATVCLETDEHQYLCTDWTASELAKALAPLVSSEAKEGQK